MTSMLMACDGRAWKTKTMVYTLPNSSITISKEFLFNNKDVKNIKIINIQDVYTTVGSGYETIFNTRNTSVNLDLPIYCQYISNTIIPEYGPYQYDKYYLINGGRYETNAAVKLTITYKEFE